jgi:hypothetical protein
MAELGRFGILVDGGPITLGDDDISPDLRLRKWMVGEI